MKILHYKVLDEQELDALHDYFLHGIYYNSDQSPFKRTIIDPVTCTVSVKGVLHGILEEYDDGHTIMDVKDMVFEIRTKFVNDNSDAEPSAQTTVSAGFRDGDGWKHVTLPDWAFWDWIFRKGNVLVKYSTTDSIVREDDV